MSFVYDILLHVRYYFCVLSNGIFLECAWHTEAILMNIAFKEY